VSLLDTVTYLLTYLHNCFMHALAGGHNYEYTYSMNIVCVCVRVCVWQRNDGVTMNLVSLRMFLCIFVLFPWTPQSQEFGTLQLCSRLIVGLLKFVCQYTGWPEKVSHYQMIQKSYEIVLKPVNKIKFIRQIKVSIKHYNIISWYKIFYTW